MAIITLTSASGSPGVTTTALGLALVWPRPVVLVEADPTGGSALLAGYWRGQLDHVGLLDLVLAERHGLLADVQRRHRPATTPTSPRPKAPAPRPCTQPIAGSTERSTALPANQRRTTPVA